MFLELTIAVDGSLQIMDAEEEAPLVKVQFFNEMSGLSDEIKFLVGKMMLAALGTESAAEAMGDKTTAI